MRAKSFLIASVCAALFAAAGVQAAAPKPPRATQGTTVTLPVTASVEVANDQAVIELYVLEQSKDIAQATTKAIERAAEGLKQLKALYPQAELKNQTLTSTPRWLGSASVCFCQAQECRAGCSVRAERTEILCLQFRRLPAEPRVTCCCAGSVGSRGH